MNILHKISFIVLISILISCNKQEKLIDTWISSPIDTIYTSWDISKDKIVSNLISPDKLIAKYKIQGNKIVIDSGAVLLDYLYVSENEFLQFKLSKDNLKIILPAFDSLFYFDFERRSDLLVSERLFPEKMLNIDLPYLAFSNSLEVKYSDWIFLGYPKGKFLGDFANKSYMQLNDVLTNPGDPILIDFVSFDYQIPTVVFCDKVVKMDEFDSVRGNLYNHKIIIAGLDENLEFGYLETDPYYYCNCISISNIPPHRPIHEQCKHKLYLEMKTNKNHFRIDSVGNYYYQDSLINIDDVPKIVNSISTEDNSDQIIYAQYDDLTSYDSYIKLYSHLKLLASGLDKRIVIIDINDKDLKYIEKASPPRCT